jgi:hypothetical protein
MSVVMGSAEVNRFNPRPLTNLQGGRGFGIRYPSPFFDVAQQFLPENVHQLHVWCRYYFLTNPVINAACSKMAEYPVTPLVYDTEDEKVQKLYKGLENQLRLRQFQVEVGLDYFVYGNAFVSIFFPFIKFLVCPKCDERYRAEKNRSLYRWKNQRFFLRCAKCKNEGYAKEQDVYIRSVRDIRLVRWNPENVEIHYNEITGKSKYYFKMPRSVVNDIKIGDRDAIESLPLEFLEAARKNKALVFDQGNFYHLKRPTLAQKDQGWGMPLIFPLLKDAFYLQVMKKAQESLLMEHVVPLRVVYPGPSTGGNDAPYGSYNLSNWKAKIDAELNLWKRDHNYIPILPVNVGFQQWGGQAKALILHQEFRIHAEQMLAGAGIPVEFVFGGLQWSGSNTSLRALENMFMGYNGQRHELINDFVIGRIAAYMRWPKVNARFDRFKMADDLQRAMFYLQLNQANKLSDRRLHEELGEDFDLETTRMKEELKTQLSTQRKMQVASADIQGEAMLHTSRYQAKATKLQTKAQIEGQMEAQQEMAGAAPGQEQPMPGQEEAPPGAEAGQEQAMGPQGDQEANDQNVPVAMSGMTSPLQQGAGGVDLRYVAQRAASYLRTIRDQDGEQAMYQAMEQMQTQNPQMYQLVVQLMNDTGSKVNPMDAQKNPAGAGTPQADVSRQIG